jgi:hypothetical protein
MRPDPTPPTGGAFAPSQEDLDQLSDRLNQRFHDEQLRRLPRQLQEWEDRHSFGHALRALIPEPITLSKDLSWVFRVFLPFIYLLRLVFLLIEIVFLPLTLGLLLIRRLRTPKPAVGDLPKINLNLAEITCFLELKHAVDRFVIAQRGLFAEVPREELEKLCAAISRDLDDPVFREVRRIAEINTQLRPYRTWIRERRWRFLYPDLAAKADQRKTSRISIIARRELSPSARETKEIQDAFSESARVKAENIALAALPSPAAQAGDDTRPPCFFLLEYHVTAAPTHSVSIYLAPAETTIRITRYSAEEAAKSSLFAQPLKLALEYGETADCKTGSFTRQPTTHRWVEFNQAIRALNLAGREGDLGEQAADRTTWTLFVHYGDSFVFAGDSSRGPLGNKVAAAVAQLIAPPS